MSDQIIIPEESGKTPTQKMAIVFSVLVIVAFFLPWFEGFFSSESGFDVLKMGLEHEPKVLFLLVPFLTAIIAIIVSIRGSNPKIYGIPTLLIVSYLVIRILIASSRNRDPGDLFSSMEVGMHMTWIGYLLIGAIGMLGSPAAVPLVAETDTELDPPQESGESEPLIPVEKMDQDDDRVDLWKP